MSHGINKVTAERNQRTLIELAQKPGNDACADCKSRTPRWASHNLGIFICVGCAGIHRKMGTHISKVKSVTLDTWSKEQVEIMKQNGNVKSNAYYNPNEARNPPPTNMVEQERDSELEKFIRAKYEFKRFIDRSANTAAQLGASSSSSSAFPSAPRANAPQARSVSAAPPTSYVNPPRGDSLGYRPSTTTAPQTQTNRSISQPLPSQQPPPAPQPVPAPSKPSNPVWDDLVSLQGPSAASSLPLQYQPNIQTTALPTQQFATNYADPNGPSPFGQAQQMGSPVTFSPVGGGMGTQAGMGSMPNPFQQQQQQQQPIAFQPTNNGAPNPFAQQSFLSQGMTGAPSGPFAGMQPQPTGFQSHIQPFSQSPAGQQFQASLQQTQNQSMPWSAGPAVAQPQPQLQIPTQAPFGQQQSPFGQQPSPFGQQPSPFGQQPSPFGQQHSPFGQQPSPQPLQQQQQFQPQQQQMLPQGNPFTGWQQQQQQQQPQQGGYQGQQGSFPGQQWGGSPY